MERLSIELEAVDFFDTENSNFDNIERKLREFYKEGQENPQNCPIIVFRNIDCIAHDKTLIDSLLPIFDYQQNSNLFSSSPNGSIDLSQFILLATTKDENASELPKPLLSRLD